MRLALRCPRVVSRDGDDDVHAARILNNQHWAALSEVLNRNGFLRVETRDASGGRSKFYHIRQPERLLLESPSDPEVVAVFQELSAAIRK